MNGLLQGTTPTLTITIPEEIPVGTITADANYDGLSSVSVTVAAIPYAETSNTYGTTVTIG